MRWTKRMAVCLAVMVSAAFGRGTQEAYVWQRQFDREVAGAVVAAAPQLDGICVLGAEVTWKNGIMDVVRPAVDFETLGHLRIPVGLALRVGDYRGAFASGDATAKTLSQIARELLAKAAANRLTVAELQVDFDCAESKLAGYRQWLAAFREVTAASGTRLVFTALPVWLKHADFVPLARAASGFVLQVHSLEKPGSPDTISALCDPVQALAWARQAGAAGVPFRVALPTYGYVLGFDPAGKFLGLAAEGPSPAWPPGTQQRVLRADAAAMARLAAGLLGSPPSHCTGVIWFRLPVPRDRYNWDVTTFAAVLRGEVTTARLTVAIEQPEPGLVEIVVANSGQTTEPLPSQLELRWPNEARMLAGDGIGGFRLEISRGAAQAMVRAANVTTGASIAPGRKVRIAWLRFAHETPVEVSLASER